MSKLRRVQSFVSRNTMTWNSSAYFETETNVKIIGRKTAGNCLPRRKPLQDRFEQRNKENVFRAQFASRNRVFRVSFFALIDECIMQCRRDKAVTLVPMNLPHFLSQTCVRMTHPLTQLCVRRRGGQFCATGGGKEGRDFNTSSLSLSHRDSLTESKSLSLWSFFLACQKIWAAAFWERF